MIDMADDSGEGLNFGIPLVRGPFQRLTGPQKYTVLEEVTTQLVTETPVPVQTAINESAIYYVFRWLEQIFTDTDCGIEAWGEKVLHALADEIATEPRIQGEPSFWPDMECDDMNKWCRAIEYIASKILWNRNCEREDRFMALKGKVGEFRAKALMTRRGEGMDPSYFAPFEGRAKPGARDRLYYLINPWCK